MATTSPDKRMIHWELDIAGGDATYMLREYINSFSWEYKINGVSRLDISVTSVSYVEDFFVPNLPVELRMGYYPTSLITVFRGKVTKEPTGSASDKMSYSLVCAGNESSSMGNRSQNRTYQGLNKAAIISQVASRNGYQSNVFISDSNILAAGNSPIQRSQTDLEFLRDCASRWDCIMWFDQNDVLYFHDAGLAHDEGDLNRTINDEDLLPDYDLGYRTDQTKNNIELIEWRFKNTRGGGSGGGVRGADENGNNEEEEDYTVEYNGMIYRLKPAHLARVRENPLYWTQLSTMWSATEVANLDTNIREYFVAVRVASSTNADMSGPGSHNGTQIEVKAKLNSGDLYLRPPRHAKLYSGTENPRADTADLPLFLYRYDQPQRYNIDEVENEYKNGNITTQLKMSLARQTL